MKRIQEESMSKEWEYPKRNFLLAPTFEQTLEWLNRIIKNKTRVCFDIETTYTPIPRLTAIGFADSPTNAICIPFTFSKGTEVIAYWSTVEEELVILNKVKELLEDETIEKVAQNAQFDTTVLEVNPPGIIVKGLYLDTMCAFHTIYPELEKGLAVLCSIYTKQPYYKHLRESGSDEIFWEYNCLDTTVTLECAIQIEKELEEFGVKDFYYKYVHPLIPILKEMQIRGIKIDLAVHSKALEEYTKAADELQLKLNERVGRELNVMSPKQMREFLYIDEKLPPKFKRGKAKEKQAIGEELTIDDSTVDEESLMAIASQHPDRDYLRWVVEIRGYRKLIGTYLEGLMGDDGRARCSYLIGGDKDGVGGTETGRLSSRESIFGSGTNLQNIPKGVCRKMFVPDESQVFVEADLEQAEARVVAYLAEEERLIDLFNKGGDIHTQNAAWIFGKSLEKVSGPERELAKRLVHASNYGIGPRTFAYHAGIKEGEAKLLLAKYFDTFPKIKSWQLGIQAGLSESRILTTPFGRKRIFFAR
jgi:DNA polymerase-1